MAKFLGETEKNQEEIKSIAGNRQNFWHFFWVNSRRVLLFAGNTGKTNRSLNQAGGNFRGNNPKVNRLFILAVHLIKKENIK